MPPAASVLKKATDSQPSKIPWMDHGLLIVRTRGPCRMYFQHYLMKKEPPSRTPKESPEVYQIVRYVPSIHSTFESDLYFKSIFLESQTRNPRSSGYCPNAELHITQTCDVIVVSSSIYEVLQLARSDMFSLEDPTQTQDIQRGETRLQ